MSNNKRLERDLSKKVLGGVCSGLGNYFDMDPTIWRILFLVLFFGYGTGLLIYIVLWIAMPEGNYRTTPGTENIVIDPDGKPAKDNGRWLAGLVLIGIGVLWLLGRYIPQINWHNAWPIALICIGIFFLLPINQKKS